MKMKPSVQLGSAGFCRGPGHRRISYETAVRSIPPLYKVALGDQSYLYNDGKWFSDDSIHSVKEFLSILQQNGRYL